MWREAARPRSTSRRRDVGPECAECRDHSAFLRRAVRLGVSEPSSDQVKLAMVGCGEGGINGVIGQAPQEDEEGVRHAGLIVYVKVDDVASYLAKAEQLGGKRIWGPEKVAPGMIIAHFEDPEGHRIGLST